MYAWMPFLMRQYPVDAACHAQVSLGKVIAGGTVKILSQIDRGGLGPALL